MSKTTSRTLEDFLGNAIPSTLVLVWPRRRHSGTWGQHIYTGYYEALALQNRNGPNNFSRRGRRNSNEERKGEHLLYTKGLIARQRGRIIVCSLRDTPRNRSGRSCLLYSTFGWQIPGLYQKPDISYFWSFFGCYLVKDFQLTGSDQNIPVAEPQFYSLIRVTVVTNRLQQTFV